MELRILLFVFANGFLPQILCLGGGFSGFFRTAGRILAANRVTGLIFCRYYECCNDHWIPNNTTRLRDELTSRLYGQHLVKRAVLNHIRGHVRNDTIPNKALALFFHGPTGTGKNHVSRIIAETLYRDGLKSENVRLVAATSEFVHSSMVSEYKDKLKKLVESQVWKCPKSLFIFDEVDKMPTGLIDVLKPYLDYHQSLQGVDYRRTIFLFLSNSGATSITKYMLEQYREGHTRDDLKLVEVERILAKEAFNFDSKEGLWHSDLIGNHLVTAYLPFMPLERKHVRQCIVDTLVSKKYYESAHLVPSVLVDEVIAEMTFYPPDEQLFSITGCKRVAEKVDFVMQS